jgi:hypothetical protein
VTLTEGLDADLDQELDATSTGTSAFDALVARLSRQSVEKHYDAYADIPWDDPAYAIDPDDPRWELPLEDSLGGTQWYRDQSPAVRSRIGLYRCASAMKIGLQFENILKRGLLEHAFALENRDPTFRYAYHEVIEEAHHGMMFQEFVNRAPFDLPGMPWIMRVGSDRIVKLGRRFPSLFFVFVLGGEDPIDHVQREELRGNRDLHPLLEVIMRHHVTEEARHLSFARHYLKQEVPKLGWFRRQRLTIAMPVILGVMSQMMMRAPTDLIRAFDIPDDVVREAYHDNVAHTQSTVASLRKVRRLARELGLVTPLSKQLWVRLGIWDDDIPADASTAAAG